MKKNILWVTALIAAYKHLPRAVEACKQTSESLALSGFYDCDTLGLIQKLMDCNARAEGYLNAKVLVDRTLEKLPLRYARILYLRARFNMTMEDIALKLGYSKRSTFRWYAEGLKKAACVLKADGYDDRWFEERYAKDVIIGDFYSQAEKGADVFGRVGKLSDSKKLRLRLEDAVAAGLLLSDKRVVNIGCSD